MTGFARAEGTAAGIAFACEAKSVNGKGLELRFRLPPGYDALELPLRAAFAERLKRGNVSITVSLNRAAGAATLRVNRDVLDQVIALARELEHEIEAAPPRLDGILAIRGVLESAEEEETVDQRESRFALVRSLGESVAEALALMRAGEGNHLAVIIEKRLAEIETLTREAERSAAAQPAALKARLKELVAALIEAGTGVAEERLAQEAAFLVGKADIREELDRLGAHIAAARALLAEGGAVGRRFDFLCQEFNREANTLCSKSSDIELTRIGLALKAAIEQLREQVQNVE
jgi:uncharacterized protein (TIGR00255 family)